ncbi:hypothetical protein CB1_000477008 [Camelus ferus]|nr:hypothetical protein CB1_000477008 [Camelus ferus]
MSEGADGLPLRRSSPPREELNTNVVRSLPLGMGREQTFTLVSRVSPPWLAELFEKVSCLVSPIAADHKDRPVLRLGPAPDSAPPADLNHTLTQALSPPA